MGSADLYLEIARHHLNALKSTGPPISTDLSKSPHYRHALVCSVFAAVAVEHALAELVWTRAFFQTPLKHRELAMQRARAARSIPSKLEFVRVTSELSDSALSDITDLFQYRNRLVHARITPREGMALDFDALVAIGEDGLDSEYDEAFRRAADGDSSALDEFKDKYGSYYRSLDLDGIGTLDLDAALRNYEIAEGAVAALEAELNSENWPVQTDGPPENSH